MDNQVTLDQYEGMAGFGVDGGQDIAELNKALTAGYQIPPIDGGGVLRVQSLEETMRILTWSEQHIRFWRDLNRVAAYSTVEEYNVQTSYGSEAGIFTQEGELPQSFDSSYERRVGLVKFMGVQREVSHVMTLIRPAHGPIIAQQTRDGAVLLMERLERALFTGNSAVIPESIDGVEAQILGDPIASQQNVIDLRGGVFTEDRIEEATNIVVEAYGTSTDLYCAPRALSDMGKQFYPKERITLPAPIDGVVGLSIRAVTTQAGVVPLKPSIFLRSGRNNGRKKAPTSATAPRAPTAPTIAGANVAGPIANSKFSAADVGTWRYYVTALNRYGESARSNEIGIVVAAALDALDLTITDGGGADAATGYRLYRAKVVGGISGSEEFMKDIPRVPRAAAAVVYRDLNGDLPGTSKAFLMQMNLQSLAWRQLAPMMKIPLATIAASYRWMQLLYGFLVMYAPQKNLMFINVADD